MPGRSTDGTLHSHTLADGTRAFHLRLRHQGQRTRIVLHNATAAAAANPTPAPSSATSKRASASASGTECSERPVSALAWSVPPPATPASAIGVPAGYDLYPQRHHAYKSPLAQRTHPCASDRLDPARRRTTPACGECSELSSSRSRGWNPHASLDPNTRPRRRARALPRRLGCRRTTFVYPPIDRRGTAVLGRTAAALDIVTDLAARS